MKFKDIQIGDRFFDGYSGEYWIKLNDSQAKFDSFGLDSDDIDSFDANDDIELA